jgi:prepilin-type N-terminal cleavage/methylation domain-containing protein
MRIARRDGFTLLEVLIAVVIIAIVVGLVAVAFVKIKRAVERLRGDAGEGQTLRSTV